MNFDQPHDDSEQMNRMHYGDDDSSAAYDAEREVRCDMCGEVAWPPIALDNVNGTFCWTCSGIVARSVTCPCCGGPLPSERDQETGTCKPCRVTTAEIVRRRATEGM